MGIPMDGKLIEFTICNQTFRLKPPPGGDGSRIREAAAKVQKKVAESKAGGATSDLRAVIVSAFEMALEIDDLRLEIEQYKNVSGGPIDRLIERLDQEIIPDKA
jgi:cell division protein ZapA (FtsZ GTPase activity inhibitor)